ncbi:MAG: UDP-N-acetylmuramoyl-tripeptide--D-alanyl-D-alanine ligase [Acidimicrobiia bacterium]|nr:UDP-N-acetylmuramoyl-tripeptide--D-alanyl-D-alanine ligase [Acidimicrobiia bacterium]
MRFTSRQIAEATGGTQIGPDVSVGGAAIDSRTAGPDELFVPIRGTRDGHDFIVDALRRGVEIYLTERAAHGATAIRVANTLTALHDLGRASRTRVPDLVVGVTGSVGKTTVKELLAGAFLSAGTVAASPASYNNELGVPLTLVNAPDMPDAVIVEMGARGRGHITLLCDIARPTVGVVTEVAGAHLELFKTIEEVARSKRELVEALPSDGLAVLNGDNPLVTKMAGATGASPITFGLSAASDVWAADVALDAQLRPTFTLNSPWGATTITLALRGLHQVPNALAAAAPALWRGLELDAVASGLSSVLAPSHRMALTTTRSGAMVIDDSYNANPTSVEAALESLAALAATRRVAILGLMAELGEDSAEAHLYIAGKAADLGIELIAVGTDLYGHQVTELNDVPAKVGRLDATCAVLVKGSRVIELERVIPLLDGPACTT